MSVKLIWVALTALLTIALPSWASDTTPPSALPKVEILNLKLHPSDKGEVRPWKKIGVDPFTGDALKGGQVLMKDTVIRISEVQEAWQMRRRGECVSYSLKNGDKLRTTFGADKSLPAEVAFASVAGDPERRGDICLVRADGTAVVFLDGCGNISVALAEVRKILPPAPPALVASAPVAEVVPEPAEDIPPYRLVKRPSTLEVSRSGVSEYVEGHLVNTCNGTVPVPGVVLKPHINVMKTGGGRVIPSPKSTKKP